MRGTSLSDAASHPARWGSAVVIASCSAREAAAAVGCIDICDGGVSPKDPRRLSEGSRRLSEGSYRLSGGSRFGLRFDSS